jgi:hypothetical protein
MYEPHRVTRLRLGSPLEAVAWSVSLRQSLLHAYDSLSAKLGPRYGVGIPLRIHNLGFEIRELRHQRSSLFRAI